MTSAELSRLYYVNKELVEWEEELNKAEAAIELESPKLDGQPKGSGVSKPTEQKAMAIAEIKEKIEELEAELLLEKLEIIRYIKQVDDHLIRLIIKYRCIELMTWDETAAKIGGPNTADSVRMMFTRFVNS